MVRTQRIKAEEQIDRYEERLAACEIELTVKKYFFEKKVGEVQKSHYSLGGSIINMVEKRINRRKEKQYGHQNNRYHCLVLTVLPCDKTLVPREQCKEYSFYLHKVERAYIGQKPLERTYQEEQVQQRVQNRIEKIIEKAEKHGVKRACKDTMFDVLRYLNSNKYGYKKRVVGKDISFWEEMSLVALLVLFLLVIGGAFLLSNGF